MQVLVCVLAGVKQTTAPELHVSNAFPSATTVESRNFNGMSVSSTLSLSPRMQVNLEGHALKPVIEQALPPTQGPSQDRAKSLSIHSVLVSVIGLLPRDGVLCQGVPLALALARELAVRTLTVLMPARTRITASEPAAVMASQAGSRAEAERICGVASLFTGPIARLENL